MNLFNSSEKLNDFILDIYRSNLAVELQTNFLKGIGTFIPHDKSFFDLFSCQKTTPYYFNPVSFNIPSEVLNDYYHKYVYGDYVAWLFTKNTTSYVYRDSDIISDELRQKSLLYLEWLQPMSMYYSAGVNIVSEQITYGSVTLLSSKEKGDFNEEQLALLKLLAKHLELRFFQLYPSGLYETDNSRMSQLVNKYHLTKREEEIVRLLDSELKIEEIGQELYISVSTVRKHVANVYRKMNINSRLQLLKLLKNID